MIFLYALEAFVVLVLIILFVTQLVIPFVAGTPFFPILRKSETAKEVESVEQELAETTELVHFKTRLNFAKEQLDDLNGKKE